MNYEKVMNDAMGTAELFIDNALRYVHGKDQFNGLSDELKIEIIKLYVDAALRDQHTMLNHIINTKRN